MIENSLLEDVPGSNVQPDENVDVAPNNEGPNNKTAPSGNLDTGNKDILHQVKDSSTGEDPKNPIAEADPLGSTRIEKRKSKDVSTQWYDPDCLYLGRYLKEDGTSEKVTVHISELEVDEDSDAESDIDDDQLPYHFAEDGSVERVDPRSKPPKKGPVVLDDSNSISVGNFLKNDGTLEELRLSFEELECDSDDEDDENAEDLLEGISATYHLGEDGSLQTLLEERPSRKSTSDGKNETTEEKSGADDHSFGEENPSKDADETIETNVHDDRNSKNDIVITEDKTNVAEKSPKNGIIFSER